MSRTQNLRQNVVNQMIDGIIKGHIRSPLPSQAGLAEMYNISRTTVRHTLTHLHQRGVLEKVKDDYVILRMPLAEDGFECMSHSLDEQGKLFEKAFYQMINQKQLRAGDSFTELQLSRAVNVSPVVVREFLLRFSRFDLIDNVRRGQWSMKNLIRTMPSSCLNSVKCWKPTHYHALSTCPHRIAAGCRPKSC